jgi:N6-L-threonylcarbamoyladenine synthase
MKKVDTKKFRVLAIESSCDETACSIVEWDNNEPRILSNIVSSQVKLHAAYGGVYPELASREHIKNILPVIEEAIYSLTQSLPTGQAGSKLKTQNDSSELKAISYQLKAEIDAIAVTVGPGLIGSLLVGVNTAKTLAYAFNKPIYAINHLEGHIYSCFAGINTCHPESSADGEACLSGRQGSHQNRDSSLANEAGQNDQNTARDSSFTRLDSAARQVIHNSPKFPILALIVSGGHTSLVLMKNHFNYEIIGETLDDAAGEVFDKVARMLDLGYPGGPIISALAEKFSICNSQFSIKPKIKNSNVSKLNSLKLNVNCKLKTENYFNFPRPMINSNNFDFSFSGLKTAVLYAIRNLKDQNSKLKAITKKSKLESNLELSNEIKSQICYEFQEAVVETLVTKTLKAAKEYKVKSILLCGGVSANKELRHQFELGIMNYELWTNDKPLFFVPGMSLTGDNAAMIGIAAAYRIALGKKPTPWHNINADSNYKLG